MYLYFYFFVGLTILFCVQFYYYCLRVIRRFSRSQKWVYVGKLEKIFIYPVDGGPGISIQEAMCLQTGFKSFDDMEDRSFIATLDGSAVTHLQNLKMAAQDLSAVLKIFHRNTRKHSKYTISRRIEYLGNRVTMQELQYDAIRDAFVKYILENLTAEFKICYFPPLARKKFMENVRSVLKSKPNKPLDGFASNYSSYTLVNTKSVNALRNCTGVKSISSSSFRPHLVIEGDHPYSEDNYKNIRIENVHFKNIIPCTHTPFINSSGFKSPENLEPYATLLRTRTLNSLRPDLSNSNSPAFGINMELLSRKHSKIAVGDRVYVKIK